MIVPSNLAPQSTSPGSTPSGLPNDAREPIVPETNKQTNKRYDRSRRTSTQQWMDALRELTVAFDEADDRALVGGVACGISVVCEDLHSTACQAVCPIRPTGSTAEPQHYSHPLLFTAQWLRSASPAMTARSRTAAYNIAHNSFAHRSATHARLWPSAVAPNAHTAPCGESESTA